MPVDLSAASFHDLLRQMHHEQIRRLVLLLQDVNEMADQRGLAALAEAIQRRCSQQFGEFLSQESRADKVVWTHLNLPELFHEAARIAQADALAAGRYWVRRNSLPKIPLSIDDNMKLRLAQSLVGFYGPTQGRGQFCHVEHYQRLGGDEYFFAYLDDYPDDALVFDESGVIRNLPQRAAFDNVFVFSPTHGTLELFARGGRKVQQSLQQLFCQSVLGMHTVPDPAPGPAYHLDHLLEPNCPLPTRPEDGIADARLLRIRLEPVEAPESYIELKADPRGPVGDIYHKIDRFLNRHHLSPGRVNVTKAAFRLMLVGEGRVRPMTFEVGHLGFCNLKSKPDPARVIGQRCLRLWGICDD